MFAPEPAERMDSKTRCAEPGRVQIQGRILTGEEALNLLELGCTRALDVRRQLGLGFAAVDFQSMERDDAARPGAFELQSALVVDQAAVAGTLLNVRDEPLGALGSHVLIGSRVEVDQHLVVARTQTSTVRQPTQEKPEPAPFPDLQLVGERLEAILVSRRKRGTDTGRLTQKALGRFETSALIAEIGRFLSG